MSNNIEMQEVMQRLYAQQRALEKKRKATTKISGVTLSQRDVSLLNRTKKNFLVV